jgi:hypothetical protein
MYGSMHSTETVTIGSSSTYIGLTGFSELVAEGVTTDTSVGTADHFTIPSNGAGDYLISYSVTGFTATTGDQCDFKVHVNGTADDNSLGYIKHQNGDIQGVSQNYIRSLSAGDEVSLRVENATAGRNMNCSSTTFSITRIKTESSAIPITGPPMYGHLYRDFTFGGSTDTIAIASSDTWYGLKDMTAGVLQGVTADTSDATADHLTIPADGAGDYLITATLGSAKPLASGQSIISAVHVDGSPVAGLTSHRIDDTNLEFAPMAMTGVVTLAAGEEISIRVGNDTGTGNVEYTSASLSITRINVDSATAALLGTPLYGELYEDGGGSFRAETIVTGGTYQGWKFATAGRLVGLTADTSDATADHLTIPSGGAGDYKITADVIWSPNTDATQAIRMKIAVNETVIDRSISWARLDGTSNVENASSSIIETLSDNDRVQVYFTSTNNSDSIQFHSIRLTANRISY